jgi:enoyl-CoA hydratase/carnithine racemase
MSSDSVLIERAGPLLTLTLNRPDNGNLIDAGMSQTIVKTLTELDEAVRVVCLRGAGADFCAGRQSPTPPPGGAVPSAERLRRIVAAPALAMYDAIKALPVPSVAVVQGRAIGVGTALAAVCDIVLAADDAVFQIPELERDIPPTLVMAALCDRVPVKTLSYLVFSRRSMRAADALAAGLLSAVWPAEQLQPEAQALLATLTGTGAVALRACKQYLQHAPALSPQAASVLASHLAGTALSARYDTPPAGEQQGSR